MLPLCALVLCLTIEPGGSEQLIEDFFRRRSVLQFAKVILCLLVGQRRKWARTVQRLSPADQNPMPVVLVARLIKGSLQDSNCGPITFALADKLSKQRMLLIHLSRIKAYICLRMLVVHIRQMTGFVLLRCHGLPLIINDLRIEYLVAIGVGALVAYSVVPCEKIFPIVGNITFMAYPKSVVGTSDAGKTPSRMESTAERALARFLIRALSTQLRMALRGCTLPSSWTIVDMEVRVETMIGGNGGTIEVLRLGCVKIIVVARSQRGCRSEAGMRQGRPWLLLSN